MTAVAEFSIVVETFNHTELGDTGRLRGSLGAAVEIAARGGEVLCADAAGSPALAALLAEFPGVRRVDAAGLGYDEAKRRAARHASARYILYLDGDCLPEPGWLEALLAPLRSGRADATGGFTRYDSGFLASVLTIMDFGFLLPRRERILECYASNNSGFRRELLLAAPAPDGPASATLTPNC